MDDSDFHTSSEKTKSIFGLKKVIKIGVNGKFHQKIYSLELGSNSQVLGVGGILNFKIYKTETFHCIYCNKKGAFLLAERAIA